MNDPIIQALNCANCGATLEVGPTARFVTCRHCHSSLEIKRSESAEWTELLLDVAKQTVQLHDDLDAMRAEQELDRLDRDWETVQKEMASGGFAIFSKSPHASAEGAEALGFAGVIFVLLYLGVRSFNTNAWHFGWIAFLLQFLCVGLPVLAAILFAVRMHNSWNAQFRREREYYLKEREKLLRRINRSE